MTHCDHVGTVGVTGFCNVCGLRPGGAELPAEAVTPANSVVPAVVPAEAERVPVQLVAAAEPGALPVVAAPDPLDRILVDPHVPEVHRFCGVCRGPVGRSVAGFPGPVEGFCPACGAGFSLSPKLHRDDLVAEQYKVLGCMARGGLGWVYLAQDENLGSRLVALKGLINTKDTQAAELAVTENKFLTALEHPNIVRIFNVVTHQNPDTGEVTSYTVMDYVGGPSLREVARAGGNGLRVEHVVEYGRQILTAFVYLHEQHQLLYCDMKPDNVIHGEYGVKLIDLGGIRRIGDQRSAFVWTDQYQVSQEEFARHHLTVRSDIFTVGKTLEELVDAVTDAGDHDLAPGVESFRRVLDRATAGFAQRFATAREMLVQLDGVHSELLSLRDGESRPPRSTVFAESAMLADSGLGQPPPLEMWTATVRDPANWAPVLHDGRPAPYDMIFGLPTPLEDSNDPAVDFLKTVHAPDATRLLRKLNSFAQDSVEVEFRACRAHLELADRERSAQALSRAEMLLGPLASYDWRIPWHRGLLRLAQNDSAGADGCFRAVYQDIPGEVGPKLALALCAEQGDDIGRAERLFRAVWTRDRTQVSAAFGLVRCCLSRGDRAGAVNVLEQVPEVSRHYDAAVIAAIRILGGRLSGDRAALPDSEALSNAVIRFEWSYVDSSGEHGEARERLETALRETALDRVRADQPGTVNGGSTLGNAVSEPGLRAMLERSYRRLAAQARTPEGHGILVDLANTVRPRTLV